MLLPFCFKFLIECLVHGKLSWEEALHVSVFGPQLLKAVVLCSVYIFKPVSLRFWCLLLVCLIAVTSAAQHTF